MWIVQQVLSQLAETALWSSTSGMWQVFLSRGEWGEEQTWLITLKEVGKGKERKESLATVLFKPLWWLLYIYIDPLHDLISWRSLIVERKELASFADHWSLKRKELWAWKGYTKLDSSVYISTMINRIFCRSLIVNMKKTWSLKKIHEPRQFCVYLYNGHLYLVQNIDRWERKNFEDHREIFAIE